MSAPMPRTALQDVGNTIGTIVWSGDDTCQDVKKSKCPPSVAVHYLEPGLDMGENYSDVTADVASNNMAMHMYFHVNEQHITLVADVNGGGAARLRNDEVKEPLAAMACHTTVDTSGLLDIRKDCFRTTYVFKRSMAQRLGRNASLILRTIEDFLYDPEHEYIDDVLAHMLLEETKNIPNPDYMQMQPYISPRMRTILVGWLLQVHIQWKLQKETWFLAVRLLDQYLSNHVVKPHELQLIVVTASCIASKYEEITPPPLRDWVRISDHWITVNDIVQMECIMFDSSGADLVKPTTCHFLEMFLDLFVNADIVQSKFARRLITLACLELRMSKYPPSCIAAAAISLSKNEIWHVQSRKTELTLQCLQELRELMRVDNTFTM